MPINVEIGRFRNIPLESRLGVLCNSNLVEDEFHVLCICEVYSDIRKTLYDSICQIDGNFHNHDDFEKFVFVYNEH